MPTSRWIHLTRAASIAGLAAFALVTLIAPQNGDLSAFFNVWVYDGLMVFACVVAGSHAYLVARERVAWTVVTPRSRLVDVRRDLVRRSSRRRRTPRWPTPASSAFYLLLYAGIVLLLRSRASLDRRHALARRCNGSSHRSRRRRSSDRRARAREHRGLHLHGRHEPRRTRSATFCSSRRCSGSSRSRAGDRDDAGSSSVSAYSRPPLPTPCTSSSRPTGRTSREPGSTSCGPRRCSSSPRRRGCPTGRATGSTSREGRSSRSPPSAL